MKKNRMMRIASVLLVAVLITACAISGTFAKYVTSDKASDSARVAKWGVALQVGGKLFGEAYANEIVANNDSTIAVQANDYASEDDFVVAPGTQSADGFKISLTGTPEVSTKVNATIKAQNIFLTAGTYGLMVEVPANTVTAVNFADLGDLYTENNGTYTKADAWAEDTTYYTLEDKVDTATLGTYYPVVFAMAGDTTYTGDDSKDTLNEIAAALAAKFGTAEDETDENNVTTYTVESAVIAPNTDLDTQFNVDDIVITWAWAFGTETDASNSVATTEDKADTILGLLMARAAAGSDALDGTVVKLNTADNTYAAPVEHTDYCLDVSFEVEIAVSQVDNAETTAAERT